MIFLLTPSGTCEDALVLVAAFPRDTMLLDSFYVNNAVVGLYSDLKGTHSDFGGTPLPSGWAQNCTPPIETLGFESFESGLRGYEILSRDSGALRL